MSNFLALATVTATLRNLVYGGISEVSNSSVTHVRPGGTAPTDPTVNVYLYQVTPNAAWRNVDLPARNTSGQLVTRPKVALDLHYLLTFYGSDSELVPQRLLGCVVRTMHASPILTRDKIRNTIKDPANPTQPNPTYPFLDASDLADEVELVKFTPIPLSLEELSKLWSVFFQTQYTLSIAYHATVVLVDADIVPVTPLPVRERQFYPSVIYPINIERVASQDGIHTPITDQSTLVISGRGLRGEYVKVHIGDAVVTPASVDDTQISLPLSLFAAGTLRPGIQGLQIAHEKRMGLVIPPDTEPKLHEAIESNMVPVVLRPRFTDAVTVTGVTETGSTPRSGKVTLPVSPKVGKSQRVTLLLNELGVSEPKSYSFRGRARTDDTFSLEISFKGVKAGTYLVRLQVDGAESLLTVDGDNKYNGPTIVVP